MGVDDAIWPVLPCNHGWCSFAFCSYEPRTKQWLGRSPSPPAYTCFPCSFNSWGREWTWIGQPLPARLSPFKTWTVGHAPTLEARGRLLSPALARSWTINSHRLTASEALTRNFSSATCASESAEEASWRRPRTLWLEMVGDAKLLHRKPWKSLESEKHQDVVFVSSSLARQGTHPQVWSHLFRHNYIHGQWCHAGHAVRIIQQCMLTSVVLVHLTVHVTFFSHQQCGKPLSKLSGFITVYPWNWDDVR